MQRTVSPLLAYLDQSYERLSFQFREGPLNFRGSEGSKDKRNIFEGQRLSSRSSSTSGILAGINTQQADKGESSMGAGEGRGGETRGHLESISFIKRSDYQRTRTMNGAI